MRVQSRRSIRQQAMCQSGREGKTGNLWGEKDNWDLKPDDVGLLRFEQNVFGLQLPITIPIREKQPENEMGTRRERRRKTRTLPGLARQSHQSELAERQRKSASSSRGQLRKSHTTPKIARSEGVGLQAWRFAERRRTVVPTNKSWGEESWEQRGWTTPNEASVLPNRIDWGNDSDGTGLISLSSEPTSTYVPLDVSQGKREGRHHFVSCSIE